ncbi:hypothetical protein AAMO2058_000834900 [Amorphochlora amoebiformis]
MRVVLAAARTSAQRLGTRRAFGGLASQQNIDGLSNDLLISLSMNHNNDGRTQAELVANLARNNLLKSDFLIETMTSVDRLHFLLPDQEGMYEDKPRNIGSNATITSPHMHAIALQALFGDGDIPMGSLALDIGCGSGYLTVCMASILAERDGVAYGIDHARDLVQSSRRNAERSHPYLVKADALHFFQGDGFLGLEEKAPFRYIHVGAAVEDIPTALIDQLAPDGRLLIPVGPEGSDQDLLCIKKDTQGNTTKEKIMSVVFSRMHIEPPDTEEAKRIQLEEKVKQLYNEAESLTKEIRNWQAKFKEEHSSRPGTSDIRKDPIANQMLQRFSTVQSDIKRTTAALRVTEPHE